MFLFLFTDAGSGGSHYQLQQVNGLPCRGDIEMQGRVQADQLENEVVENISASIGRMSNKQVWRKEMNDLCPTSDPSYQMNVSSSVD